MGIISAVLIPAAACIAGAFLYMRKKQSKGSSMRSWRYSERDSGIDNESTLLKRTVPLKPDDRTNTPISDTSSIDNSKKRRSYDRVYRTHEPLPDRPYIDFEEKEWDLREPNSPNSPTGSDSTDSIKKRASPTKESDV